MKIDPDKIKSFTEKMEREARERKLAERILLNRPVYVSFLDSLNAGNCNPGTLKVAKIISDKFGCSINDAIDARALLIIRDDEFTRKACLRAARKYLSEEFSKDHSFNFFELDELEETLKMDELEHLKDRLFKEGKWQ